MWIIIIILIIISCGCGQVKMQRLEMPFGFMVPGIFCSSKNYGLCRLNVNWIPFHLEETRKALLLCFIIIAKVPFQNVVLSDISSRSKLDSSYLLPTDSTHAWYFLVFSLTELDLKVLEVYECSDLEFMESSQPPSLKTFLTPEKPRVTIAGCDVKRLQLYIIIVTS